MVLKLDLTLIMRKVQYLSIIIRKVQLLSHLDEKFMTNIVNRLNGSILPIYLQLLLRL